MVSTVKASRETNTMGRDIRSWLGNADCGSADEAYVTHLPAETLPTPRRRQRKIAGPPSTTHPPAALHFVSQPHFTHLVMALLFPQKVKKEAKGNNHNHKTHPETGS